MFSNHNVTAATTRIVPYHFQIDKTPYCLVDTPGFDDAYSSDQEILRSISDWLTDSYRKGVRVSAILYIHRISNTRMQGSSVNNFRIFRALCGDDFGSRVRLCTTFWDLYEHTPEVPLQRMKELEDDDFWGEMCRRGSSICRVPDSQAELRAMIATVARPDPIALKIQHEVVDEGKSMQESSFVLQMQLEKQRQEHQQNMDIAKSAFEEQLRAREKKMAEDLEKMQKQFDDQLRAQQDETQRIAEQMKRRLSEQAAPSFTERPPLPPRRAKTDLKSRFDAQIRDRQGRAAKFSNAVKSTMNVLTLGKRNGHVKCDFNMPKPGYTAACDNCTTTIAGRACYG